MYIKVIVIPLLLFISAMLTLFLISNEVESEDKSGQMFKLFDKDLTNAFFAFPKENMSLEIFNHHLESILLDRKDSEGKSDYHMCSEFKIPKNVLLKSGSRCVPYHKTIDISNCICNGHNCVLKMNTRWHTFTVPFNKKHFVILPPPKQIYLESYRKNGLLFYDVRNANSLPLLRNILSTARMRSMSTTTNARGNFSLHTSLQSLSFTEEEDTGGRYSQMALLFSTSLMLAGLCFGVLSMSSQVIEEIVRGEKLLTISYGVSKYLYWGAFIIWDAMIVIITVFFLIFTVALFYNPIFVFGYNLPALSLLALLYGLSVQVMTYLTAKVTFFESHFVVWALALHICAGIFPQGLLLFCQEFNHLMGMSHVKAYLHIIFLLLPQHAFVDGVMRICNLYFHNRTLYRKGDELTLSAFDWRVQSDDIHGPFGVHFIALFLWVFAGYVILIILEKRECIRNKFQDMVKRNNREPGNEEENYDNSNLSLLISGLSYEMNGEIDQWTTYYDIYACRGECLTVSGLNGCECSVLLQYMSGERDPPPGSIYLVDEEGAKTTYAVRRNLLEISSRVPALDPNLTTQEELRTAVCLRGITGNTASDVVDHLVRTFHLRTAKNQRISILNEDEKRKLSLAKTIIGDPTIVILQDPMKNCSTEYSQLLKSVIRFLKSSNCTVIVLSNCLEEAESISDRLAVFENGRVVYIGKTELTGLRMQGRYIVKINAEKAEDVSTIIGLLKQDIREFTVIEKYNTRILADTSSEVTPYAIFGAISKARKIAQFWFEVASMSLPQYYQRLGLHPTRNSSYSSANESVVNEIPNIIISDEDSCSSLTIPVFRKASRDSFYDSIEEDMGREKIFDHRRPLSRKGHKGRGSSKLTPCSTPHPPQEICNDKVLTPTDSSGRTSFGQDHTVPNQVLKMDTKTVSALPTDELQSNQHKDKPEYSETELHNLKPCFSGKVKNQDLFERFIRDLPKVAPKATFDSSDETTDTLSGEESELTCSEERTEF